MAPEAEPPPVPQREPQGNSGTLSRAVPRRRSSADAARSAPAPQLARAASAERITLDSIIRERLPSWLVSVVIHALLIIALGLIVFKVPFRTPHVELFDIGGGSGQPGNGLDASSAAAMLPASGYAAEDTLSQLAPTVDLFAPQVSEAETFVLAAPTRLRTDEVSDLVGRALNDTSEVGGGTGPGTGFGTGTGEGAGNDGEGTGYGSAPTRTAVFGVVEEASSFVYVFDHSESMTSMLTYTSEGKIVFTITPLEAAKAELLRSLQDLDRRQSFQIVFYNHEWQLFQPYRTPGRLLPATQRHKEMASQFVAATNGEGGTLHINPLEVALNMHPDVIYLLTDGEAKDDLTRSDLSRLRAMNKGRTRINVIHFCFTPRPDSTLVKLAEENRGQHLSYNISRLGAGINAAGVNDPTSLGATNPPAPPRRKNAPVAP